YVSNPPSLTRGCVKVYGTPTAASPGLPAYDSIMVTGQAWVTIPFVGPQSFNSDIPVYYRVLDTVVSIDRHTFSNFGLAIAPNPVGSLGNVSYKLNAAANVELRVHDVFGKEVMRVDSRLMGAGTHEEVLKLGNLPSGIYFLKAVLNAGEYETTEKFLKLN
ncbi:MAG TPA: T9SS type A sorting domain-containing protein, partial [Bacteroidia bacterium]|nr:T9SS type A sorting domain-containing protein [Bacteroidia bacterium]